MSRSLLLAQPSVPMARLTPARCRSRSRAEARGQLEVGFRAMHHADAALGAQRDLGVGQLGHVHRDQAVVDQAEPVQPRQRALAVLLAATRRLPARSRARGRCTGRSSWSASMRMRSKLASRHGVRRMRRERGARPADRRATGRGLRRRGRSIRRPTCAQAVGKSITGRPTTRAEAVALVGRGLHVGEEVVLVAAGGAAAQHLGDRQRRRRRRRTPGRSPRLRSARCGPAATPSAAGRRRRRAAASSGCGCGR